jgi:hypothetical protein
LRVLAEKANKDAGASNNKNILVIISNNKKKWD